MFYSGKWTSSSPLKNGGITRARLSCNKVQDFEQNGTFRPNWKIILYKVQDKVTFELRVTIILYKVQDYQFVE